MRHDTAACRSHRGAAEILIIFWTNHKPLILGTVSILQRDTDVVIRDAR